LLVRWVGDRSQIIGISPRTSAIFGGTGTRTFEANGILLFRVKRRKSLEQDFVLPIVAVIVSVHPAGFATRLGHAPADQNTSLVDQILFVLRIIQRDLSEAFSFNREVVQMGVFPAECRLDVLVQFGQRAVGDLNPPPNGRIDFP